MKKELCVVFGTYNRLPLLRNAVASVRRAAEGVSYEMVVIDGGSKDGSKEFLAEQKDVTLICQEGPLTGAVKAFNLGFGYAVDNDFDYVFHFNDDAEVVTDEAFRKAIYICENPLIGEVAFEFNLRGSWAFEHVNQYLYANYGLIRREAGMDVAKAQGDPTGRNWWNPIYRTYGADCEFGCQLWMLGYHVVSGYGLRVNDLNAQDELRVENESHNPNRSDSLLFWDRVNNLWKGKL